MVGTPPNAALAGVASDRFGVDIGFVEWLAVGLPISTVLLAVVFCLLVGLHKVPLEGGDAAAGTVAATSQVSGHFSPGAVPATVPLEVFLPC